LNAEELKRVEELIDKLTKEIKEYKANLKKLESEFSKMEDTAAKRGIQNKAVKDLFEDIEVVDGIEVFKGDDGEKADEDEEFDPNEL
jgi:predicted RNase H-like nuclease (RuvC/YqgF family)